MLNEDLNELVKTALMLTSEETNPFSRVPLMNTKSLIKELIEAGEFVEKRKLSSTALSPIVKEINKKTGNDPIYLRLSKNCKPIPKKNEMMLWAKENYSIICEKYLDTAFTILEEKISNGETDAEFKKVVSYLLSELIDVGFSTEYIHEYIRNLLKNEGGGDPEKRFKNFRERFSSGLINYIVVFKACVYPGKNKGLLKLNNFPKFRGKTDREIEFFQRGHFYIPVDLKAYDRFSARDLALSNVKFFIDSIELIESLKINIKDECLIYAPKGKPALIRETEKPMYLSNFCSISYKRFFEIVKYLDDDSRRSFENAISAFNTALKAKTPEIQFTFFWTALEALVTNPEKKKIIDTVINSLSPIIIKSYGEMSKDEISFTLQRLYKTRNLLIHKYDIYYKLEASIPIISQCCASVFDGIINLLDSESCESTSLEKIYNKSKLPD